MGPYVPITIPYDMQISYWELVVYLFQWPLLMQRSCVGLLVRSRTWRPSHQMRHWEMRDDSLSPVECTLSFVFSLRLSRVNQRN